MKKIHIFCLVLISFSAGIFAQVQSSQSNGEKLFRLNRPEAAIPVLEKEIAQPGSDPVLYNYLGLSYYQIKKYPQALSAFQRGLEVPYSDTYTLNLNAGNAAFALNDFSKALEYYSAAEAANPEKTSPILNKANTYLKLKRWGDAKAYYEKFIEKDSDNAQTPKIKILIGLLDTQIENDRLAQEALLAQTEQLPDNVANLSAKQGMQAESELVDGKYVAPPIPVPLSEKVDESLPVKSQAQIESEIVSDSLPAKTPAQIESEKVAEQLAQEKKRQAASEFVEQDNFPARERPDSKPAVQKVAKPEADLDISEEPVGIEELLQDQKKIIMAHAEEAELKSKNAIDDSDAMRIDVNELDKIPNAERISCSIKVLTEDFSPDRDGVDDIAKIALSYENSISYPESWKVEIKDQGGSVIKTFNGKGKVPEQVEWDGISDRGEEVVYSAEKYEVDFEIIPNAADKKRTGITYLSAKDEIHSGILMIRKGEAEWKIVVMSFRFDADQETFDDLTIEQQLELEQTFRAIVRQLKKHEDCIVTVEGYGNNISGTEKENREEVLPLSEKRAKVIMEELIKHGVKKEQLAYVGRGDKNPIDTSSDPKNWWKNRRVEFSIKKKK